MHSFPLLSVVCGPSVNDDSPFVCRLYYHFRPDYWFWIIIILVRKFMIALTSLMFNRNPAFQMAMALLTLFICYALQVRCGRWTPFNLRMVCVRVAEQVPPSLLCRSAARRTCP